MSKGRKKDSKRPRDGGESSHYLERNVKCFSNIILNQTFYNYVMSQIILGDLKGQSRRRLISKSRTIL